MDREELLDAKKVLLFAAHPDDETISAGTRLFDWRERLLILHATDGAPRDGADAVNAGFDTPEAYGQARRKEMLAAVALAGVEPDQCREAGFADQGTSRALERLTRELVRTIDQFEPEILVTHPYEGGHPDHDSCAFAAAAAVRLARAKPRHYEFASYHAGPEGMITGEFLPGGPEALVFELTADERRLKQRMFECHRSQREMLKLFHIGREQFRPSPPYDFAAPPHEGRLNYEWLPWGMEGPRWRALAAAAAASLGIQHAAHGT